MAREVKKSLTIGELSRRLGCPIHRLDYFLRTRGVKPIERAGRFRVYDESVLDLLRSELSKRCPADHSTVFAGGTGGVQA